MSASPIGPVFAGMLWRTAKAMNDLHGAGPPTTEFRACWQCGGTKVLDDRICRLCNYRGEIEYEVRR